MSFQDMINDAQTILARADCSQAQMQIFLQQGISRIQRTCRLPSMERAQLITPNYGVMTQFPVPTDLLQIIDVIVPEPSLVGGPLMRPLRKTSYRDIVRMPQNIWPEAYARWQTMIYIAGALPEGLQLQFLYYGNFTPFASLTSENELSASTPDLGVYAALAYAGDYFEHPRAAQWEAMFQAIKGEVEGMAVDLEGEGGPQAIQPLYQHYDEPWSHVW